MVTVSNAGVDRQSRSLSYIAGENENDTATLENRLAVFFIKLTMQLPHNRAIALLGIYLTEMKIYVHTKTNINVRNSLFS